MFIIFTSVLLVKIMSHDYTECKHKNWSDLELIKMYFENSRKFQLFPDIFSKCLKLCRFAFLCHTGSVLMIAKNFNRFYLH